MIVYINDLSAPELDVYRSLTSGKGDNDGLFIAESMNVIESALEAGCKPVSMLSEERHIRGKAAPLVERLAGIPIYTAADDTLRSITGYELHRGMLCAFRRPACKTAESVMAGTDSLCVLEGLTDTTNLGAIFRSAAAFGVGGVLLASCCDPLSRRALRVSTGNVFRVPWAEAGEGWPQLLKAQGYKLYALALTDDSIPLGAPVLRQNKKRALVFGNEGLGLKKETVNICDYTVKIPMSGGVDSLNVSNAAAVAFWELRAGN